MINPTKTCIVYPKLEFLGYSVNADGIKISPLKIKAIKKLQPPTNRRSLQRLLGLLQFFKKHILMYSSHTSNMRQLLKQDTNFTWSDECQRELDELKTAVISSPVLHPFRNDRKIYIYVDGSQSGLGSCAVQMGDDGKPHLCLYMSYATTDSQERWASYQLELAALGMTQRQHESLFLQSDLEVFSENAVVVILQKYKPMNNRKKRLLAYVNQFTLKLCYISGRLNKVADALSRLPEDTKSSDTIYFQLSEKVKKRSLFWQ